MAGGLLLASSLREGAARAYCGGAHTLLGAGGPVPRADGSAVDTAGKVCQVLLLRDEHRAGPDGDYQFVSGGDPAGRGYA